jgi:hypothetical protein
MENKKVCPLKFCGQNNFAQTPWCEKEDCAFWCGWASCCALVAIPSEISDRMHDLEQTIGK